MEKPVSDMRFQWQRPANGHKWSGADNASRLTPLSPKKEKFCALPGAFRKFALIGNREDVNLSDQILEFADAYGDVFAHPDKVHGPAENWNTAIQQMRRAVFLWDRIKDPKTNGETHRRELQKQIEKALSDRTTPSHTTLGFTQELRIIQQPVNLLAYMWLTLARVVSGEIEERPCLVKGKSCLGYMYFGKGPGLRRNDPMAACGAACRKHRERNGK